MSSPHARRGATAPNDVVPIDRFCRDCGTNVIGIGVHTEPRYGMLVATCPSCRRILSAHGIPGGARTDQRWQGLALALWMLALCAAWTGTNATMIGITVGVLEQADARLTEFVRQEYRAATGDDGDAFVSGARIVPTAQAPIAPTIRGVPPTIPGVPGSPGSVQVVPAGPRRVIVLTNQDPDLRRRFADWWAEQDADGVLARAGGVGASIPWRRLAPGLLFGLAPFAWGVLWTLLLPGASRRRRFVAWPVIGIGFVATLVIMVIVFRYLTESPSHVATAMLMPVLLPLVATYLAASLLGGLILGRPLLYGTFRFVLPPRGSAMLRGVWDTGPMPRELGVPRAPSGTS